MDDILLVGAMLLGACVQWLTGMGFALVAVPALVLLLGPSEGVTLANCASGVICLIGLVEGWRSVRVAAMVPLCVAAVCTVPAGTWLTRHLAEPVLLTVMGALVALAVLLVMCGARIRALRGTKGAVAAGALGGHDELRRRSRRPADVPLCGQRWLVGAGVLPNAFLYGVVVNTFSVAAHGVPQLATARRGWSALASP